MDGSVSMSSGMVTRDYPPSFERNFLLCLETIIHALPPNTATLQTKDKIDDVTFKISPANQGAATIEGHASTQGGIVFKIGRVTTVELSRFKENRFVQICEAV